MNNVVEIIGLTKKYRNQVAVNNVSFALEANKIYGLLGRNGAGKTTIMHMITAQAFPRVTTPPAPVAAPRLTLPSVDTARLGNGLTVLVSRNAEVPVVTAQLVIDGGARSETDLFGLATFTAGMLDEGAAGKSALELAEAVEFLGARLGTGAGWESFNVSLSGPPSSSMPWTKSKSFADCCPSVRAARRSGTTKGIGPNWKLTFTSTPKRSLRTAFVPIALRHCSRTTSRSSAEIPPTDFVVPSKS